MRLFQTACLNKEKLCKYHQTIILMNFTMGEIIVAIIQAVMLYDFVAYNSIALPMSLFAMSRLYMVCMLLLLLDRYIMISMDTEYKQNVVGTRTALVVMLIWITAAVLCFAFAYKIYTGILVPSIFEVFLLLLLIPCVFQKSVKPTNEVNHAAENSSNGYKCYRNYCVLMLTLLSANVLIYVVSVTWDDSLPGNNILNIIGFIIMAVGVFTQPIIYIMSNNSLRSLILNICSANYKTNLKQYNDDMI